MDWEMNSDALQSTLTQLAHLLIESSRLSLIDDSEVGVGGYGDVYLATLDGSSKVAVKQLRIIQKKAVRIRVAMRLARELKIWAKANHPNVLKLIGYHLSEKYDCAQLISPYMENGNIVDYMKQTQPSIEVRLGFVRDVTLGMAYLHGCSPPICHGDLKPLNVLISDKPDAVLCDFGLALFIEDSGAPSGLTTSKGIKVSPRYMSPELLDEEEAKHTLESDIWAWACTIFEIITDIMPYANLRTDRGINAAVGRGASPGSVELLGGSAQAVDTPFRLTLFSLQSIIRECWSVESGMRPSSSSILDRLDYVDLGNPDLASANMPLDDKQTSDSAMTTERIITDLSILSNIQLSREPDHVKLGSRTADKRVFKVPSDRGITAAAAELMTQHLFIERERFASGAFSDMYRGRWDPPEYPGGIDVLVRVSRLGSMIGATYTAYNERYGKYLEQEVLLWRRVDHPRVTPFIGYVRWPDDPVPRSVTLQRPENLRTYVTLNRQADGLRLLCQALEGLVYLHTFSPSPIVHGALKPENILITSEGTAELCDFAYAKILDEFHVELTAGSVPREHYRYMAPETLRGNRYRDLTTKADIYAIGSTILFALSGKDPWHHFKSASSVNLAIYQGELPKWADHPMQGSEEDVKKMWHLLERCWRTQPNQRPSAQEVLDELSNREVGGAIGQDASPASGGLLDGFAPRVDTPSRSILVALQAVIRERWGTKPEARPSLSRIPNRLNPGDPGNGASTTKLNREFLFVERNQFARSQFSDLYPGRWEPPNDPKYPRAIDVAIKVLRLGGIKGDPRFSEYYDRCSKHLEREVSAWQKVDHPRVTPVIGYISGFMDDIVPCIVSPRRLGNIEAYIITVKPQADRLGLLRQALEGLAYLHTFSPRPIVHLAIKPENILVTDEGTAELSDFGRAEILEVCSEQPASPTYTQWDRYIPPERLMGVDCGLLTPGADIYSIGLVILYVLSGKVPWHHLRSRGIMNLAILRGELPKLPDHPMKGSEEAVKKTWHLLGRCWCMQPDQRPSAQEVLNELLEIEALGGVRPPNM